MYDVPVRRIKTVRVHFGPGGRAGLTDGPRRRREEPDAVSEMKELARGARGPEGARLVGRTFGPAWLDYLLIGGGLSLLFTGAVALTRDPAHPVIGQAALPWFLLLVNAAHFAASTVRLYAKPGSVSALPFLTLGFPLVALALLTISIAEAPRIGRQFQSLYLTWSPYHYAAQAYGLAVMYSYRSGCRLAAGDKKLLWWTSMFPFLYNFVTAPEVGLSWLVPHGVLAQAAVADLRTGVGRALWALALAAPVLLYVKVSRAESGPMPLIGILSVVANGVWFLVLGPLDAFVWATVFHGVQYLAIATIFHVEDRMSVPGNRQGRLFHALGFYGASVVLAYALFNLLPLGFVAAGFGKVESMLMVVAAINVHHFVVDAYIWRLKPSDRNRTIVDAGARAEPYVGQPARAR